MDSEWIDARTDGSDLRVGDGARLVWGYTEACHGIVTGFETNGVCMEPGISRKPVMYRRDRTGDTYRWQYHAPTRAKLEAADRERASAAQPAPPPDDEPGWDHVPVERINAGTTDHPRPGDRFCRENWLGWTAWRTVAIDGGADRARADYWIRRAAHPERVRWLEEQKRTVNTDSAIVAAVDSTSTYARAPSKQMFPDTVVHCPECGVTVGEGEWCSCVTEAERERHYAALRGDVAPPDPFAEARAEAKRMIDAGADPRVVLGALDDCMLARLPGMFATALAGHAAHSIAGIARGCERVALAPCYHGNRAGTCGWCALSRDRSDARAVVSHEPAWETADCEGE